VTITDLIKRLQEAAKDNPHREVQMAQYDTLDNEPLVTVSEIITYHKDKIVLG
jgi:hypothetical protein